MAELLQSWSLSKDWMTYKPVQRCCWRSPEVEKAFTCRQTSVLSGQCPNWAKVLHIKPNGTSWWDWVGREQCFEGRGTVKKHLLSPNCLNPSSGKTCCHLGRLFGKCLMSCATDMFETPVILFTFSGRLSLKAIVVSQQGTGHNQISDFEREICLSDFKAKRLSCNPSIRPPSGEHLRDLAATAPLVLSSHQCSSSWHSHHR